MVDEQFFEYVISLLKEAGHMIAPDPVYVNHSIKDVIYFDSKKYVVMSESDRRLLALVDNISLIMELEWPRTNEKIQFFALVTHTSERSRSQDTGEIHFLLQQTWESNYSIIFVKNNNQFVISFADGAKSQVFSDWYDVYEDFDGVAERLSVGNISFSTCSDCFRDYRYAIERAYYTYPISIEEASYDMLPRDLFALKTAENGSFLPDIEVTKEDIREIVRANASYYRQLYGYDYIEACNRNALNDVLNYNLIDEIDRISFELDFADEYSEKPVSFHESDYTEEVATDEMDFLEGIDDVVIDMTILEDPVMLVKWLEKNNGK